ncbi:MAG: hypothetical protein JSV90_04020 [Methanobacteriota archaeon]|nr:MAG: hypothetical protein JSV90_04020 [Euryarchaeota archaeon]
MKDRILSVAVALSLLAVVFVAVPSPTEAAVHYTGTVQATDDSGDQKDVYWRGDPVYVAVESFEDGNASNETIVVELVNQDGVELNSFLAWTGVSETGLYESWTDPPIQWLSTWATISGEFAIYDVVVKVLDGPEYEIARTQITVRNEGLTLEPPNWGSYYPGQEVNITLVTSEEDDFYIQLVNDTYEDFYLNESNQDPGDEGYWQYTWIIDNRTPDGTYMLNIRDDSDDIIWYTEWVTIAKYVLLADTDATWVLPGEIVAVVYDVVEIATLTHYAGVSIEWNAVYFDEDGDEVVDTGATDVSHGTIYYQVADDIALWSDIDMMIWANESDERSSDEWLWFTVGVLSVDLDVDDGPHVPGDAVSVDVQAFVGNDELSGAQVDLSVWMDGTELDQYSASGMITDMTGTVVYDFMLDTDSQKGTYIVEVTVSKLGFEVTTMATFEVEWTGALWVEFSKDYYFSGQEASFDFKVVWNNEEVLEPTSVYYEVVGVTGLLKTGNTTTGHGNCQIPDGYVGWIEVYATTILNGYWLSDWDDADVYMADVILVPMKETYRAGDTVTWLYEIVGTMDDNSSIAYVVVDDDDVRVAQATMMYTPAGSISFDVPETYPSDSYTMELTLDDGLGHIAYTSSTVWLYANYEIHVWLESSAGFASNAYEAGATLVVGYSIEAVGVEHLDLYAIWFESSDDWVDHSVLVTEATGTFEYQVDENAVDGDYWLYVDLQDPVSDSWLSWDGVGYSVQADQSTWDRDVAGLSLFEMTVLFLLVVMVILLIIVPFLKGRAGAEKPPKPRSMEHVPPEEPEPAEEPPPAPEEEPPSS